ncbi:MAG: hypothetical protein A3C36_05790 [Omnitrophica WOR_2 bacterium RIFCSPHIGHO2_02_FULL_52_10]|nr:MAG: hypothetical protein A3C36_05790 [Omnitrophica WOR_2 bacterium RIFCSPHIGHO2_02_FULL_52_10]
MPLKRVPRQLIPLLMGSVDTYIANPAILVPFITLAFIQLLVLEVLYFSPQYPLSVFFNPIVHTLWGEEYVHYPNNFLVLPKLFQSVQVFIYVFVSSYLISIAVEIIAAINKDGKCSFAAASRDAVHQYVHIFVAALIAFCTFLGLFKLYNLLMLKVLNFSAVDGAYFAAKSIILQGTPIAILIIGAFTTALYAFVFPVIMIGKKRIITALIQNFRHLWGSFWHVFLIILVPTLFYLPVLILRHNISGIASVTVPEVRVVALVIGIIVTMFIDATIYTAITTFYLLKKEHP